MASRACSRYMKVTEGFLFSFWCFFCHLGIAGLLTTGRVDLELESATW